VVVGGKTDTDGVPLVRELLDDPEAGAESTSTPVSTMLAALDDVVGGFLPGRMWVLTSAPGQGRSTLLTQWAAQLGITHGWLTLLHGARDEPRQYVNRLLALRSGLPLPTVASPPADQARLERITAAKNTLAASDILLETGPSLALPPPWDGSRRDRPRAMLLDDVDLVGIPPRELRRLADAGMFVAATLPLHQVVADPGTGDLDPHWAAVADVMLEVRITGIAPTSFQLDPGEGVIRVLRNRRGPAYDVPVHEQLCRARFAAAPPNRPRPQG
jgi:hypothetical protein